MNIRYKLEKLVKEFRELKAKTTPKWEKCCDYCGVVFGDDAYIHVPPSLDDVDPIVNEKEAYANSAFMAFAHECNIEEVIQELLDRQATRPKITHQGKQICISCGWRCGDAEFDNDWRDPHGVIFKDCGNYGSRLYDSAYSGEGVEIVVCDECLLEKRECLTETSLPYIEWRKKDDSEDDFTGLLESLAQSREELEALRKDYEAIEERLKNGTDVEALTEVEQGIMRRYHGPNWKTCWDYVEPSPEEMAQKAKDWHAERLAERKAVRIQNAIEFLKANGVTTL